MHSNTNLMNRFFSLTILLLTFSLAAVAQVPAVKGSTSPSVIEMTNEPVDTAMENRLVILALNGPEYDASYHQNKINELALQRAKSTWLNLLSISTQLNDQSFKQPSVQAGQVAYVYPKYYFGITIPLGIIFSQGSTVKTAREGIALAKDQQQMLALQIRANVLTKYKEYKLDEEMVEMESELINDVLAMSTQAEDNFKNGSITVEAYISAQRTRNEEMVKLKSLELQRDLVQIEIERMIGVPLADVIGPRRPRTPLYRKPVVK
jgi:outer membrane protein TolC